MSIASPLLDLLRKKSKSQVPPQPADQFLPSPSSDDSSIGVRPRTVTPEATRPRYAEEPPSDYEKTVDYQNQLLNAPLGPKPPAWKGALYGALNNAGRAADRALESGNVGWGGVAQALGAGAGGGVSGALAPEIILKDRRNREVAENQTKLDAMNSQRAADAQIEERKSQGDYRRAQAQAEDRKLSLDEERQRQAAELSARKEKLAADVAAHRISNDDAMREQAKIDAEERHRHNLESEAAARTNAAANTTRARATAARGANGSGETPYQFRTRLGNFRAAQSELSNLGEQEKSAASAKDAAYANLQTARQAWIKRGEKNPDIQEDVIEARKAAEKAQENYAGFWTKKNLAIAKMKQYGDADGKEPRPAAPTPETHNLVKSDWLKTHDAKDWPKAVATAKARGYTIVE